MRKDHKYEKRSLVICLFVLVIASLYGYRLYNLQIADSKYKESAENNAYVKKTLYPTRGMIKDRNDSLLVFNKPAYDVMFIPKDVQNFDTLDFCRTVNITPEWLRQRFIDVKDKKINPGYSKHSPQLLLTHLSAEDNGRLQEKMYRFPGFFIQQRMLRDYKHYSAANILGNIREVNLEDIKKDSYLAPGDYTGDLGVEKSYDQYLRGVKGTEILIRDASGRIQGRYKDGADDTQPVSGKDLTLSIDIDLQEYAESLMVGKRGAIVAIEPSTGEILCMVTAPCYDPSLLVGRNRGKNYSELSKDPAKPLFDRALQGAYPPGSTFKPTQGLIFQHEKIVNLGTTYPCKHGYISGRLKVGCHWHKSPIALKPALQTSCNAYFCWGFKNMLDSHISKYGSTANAFEVWKKHLVSMGYGYKLGVDLPGESRGFLPNEEFYNKYYGKGRWSANTIISVSIGQGEILASPVQIANLAATVANRGWFITPHVVKEIQDNPLPDELTEKRYPTVDASYYPSIAEGMRMAVTGGTCKKANLPDIEVAGKTGTAQNPHGKDHSAFMGFAPYNNPQIAVAVYVENAGFGAHFGVPIGTLIIEKYLKGEISARNKPMEKQMLEARLSYK